MNRAMSVRRGGGRRRKEEEGGGEECRGMVNVLQAFWEWWMWNRSGTGGKNSDDPTV